MLVRMQLVLALLRSYSAAVNDPDNELIYFYDIREALNKAVSGAQKNLNLGNTVWSDFGALCNHEPVRQGRHRGKFLGDLRDASKEELKTAREFARTMIENYLDYLEKKG